MAERSKDQDHTPYAEHLDKSMVPQANDFIIQRHRPEPFDTPYHHHTSIEINYLRNCSMTYAFSDMEITLHPGRLSVFWGAAPHTVARVEGEGEITNIYLSLGQFVRWGLPTRLMESVLTGSVIVAEHTHLADQFLFDRLYLERDRKDEGWRRCHLDEIEARLRRFAMEAFTAHDISKKGFTNGNMSVLAVRHVEAMLRFISDHYTAQISVTQIAKSAHLSTSRARSLFREVMGVSIKQQLMRSRLSHARMLLAETNQKVATVAHESGFTTLSSFYDAFTKHYHMPPQRYRDSTKQATPNTLAVQP
ncbi:MAG: helix-turn-helix domain-containing protein [Gammaproteobacteria bacterium]|nr:helix-turn-helix domain-containing protein [Gammaproteobacteria bacterium]